MDSISSLDIVTVAYTMCTTEPEAPPEGYKRLAPSFFAPYPIER